LDLAHSVVLAHPKSGKTKVRLIKMALHRTRLRVLHHKNFSVSVFYKPLRQPAPPLAFCRSSATEKSEKNFSVFQFWESVEDLTKRATF
jgi:hypothetical protein